jgi:hypothetical protein
MSASSTNVCHFTHLLDAIETTGSTPLTENPYAPKAERDVKFPHLVRRYLYRLVKAYRVVRLRYALDDD